MKKMMKNYEAPMAEMFEMQMPTVLMSSPAGNSTGGDVNPIDDGGNF